MKKLSIWKKVQLFIDYRRIVLSNKSFMENSLKIRVDKAMRLYTVVNIKPDDIVNYGPKAYNQLASQYITAYLKELDAAFSSIGLTELIKPIETKKIDETNHLIVLGFKFFDTVRVLKDIIGVSAFAIIFIILYSL